MDRIEKLDKLGFIWNLREYLDDKQWNEKYAYLVEYFNLFGDSKVPHRHETDGVKLGLWVYLQRKKGNDGLLLIERRKKLEEVNFFI